MCSKRASKRLGEPAGEPVGEPVGEPAAEPVAERSVERHGEPRARVRGDTRDGVGEGVRAGPRVGPRVGQHVGQRIGQHGGTQESATGGKRAGARSIARNAAPAATIHAAAPRKVRIIGGRFKRTPLPVADVPGLRPTPDRVRETLFNWIAHLRPDLATVRGLDLFAGTGALGFELASRGAAQVTLIEREPRLVAQLLALRDKLGAPEVELLRGDALLLARTLPAGSYDLVFVDPPYDAQLVARALTAVEPLLAPAALLYVEAAESIAPELLAAHHLELVRELRAGRVHAHLLQRRLQERPERAT